MTIKAKLLFILIGDDKTGKTTLQKLLIEKLCSRVYDRLPTNLRFDITHPEIKRKYQSISFANRSYQEKRTEYGTVDEYFQNHFQQGDISVVSSHLIPVDIQRMIENGRGMFYNVCGVFLTNSILINPTDNAEISRLDWDERLVIDNPTTDDFSQVERQLNSIADNIVSLLINRTNIS